LDRFQELNAFIAVVEVGGFTAAARRLGESQSSVSKAIGSLEKRLGVALFNRSTRSVTLTDLGRRYYERARPLVDELDDADSELTSSTQGVSGFLRIATAGTFGRLHVLPLIPDLLARHPGLKVDVVLSDFVRDMIEDGIDMAIRVGPVDDPEAIVRRIASTQLVCVGSRRYFDRHGMPKSPADLVDHNCLVYSGMADSTHWPFVGPEGRFGVPVRGTLTSNSVETIRTGVLAGVGIGLFTKPSLAEDLRHPDVVSILEDFLSETRDINIIWPRRRFVPARVRIATDFFAEAIATRI